MAVALAPEQSSGLQTRASTEQQAAESFPEMAVQRRPAEVLQEKPPAARDKWMVLQQVARGQMDPPTSPSFGSILVVFLVLCVLFSSILGSVLVNLCYFLDQFLSSPYLVIREPFYFYLHGLKHSNQLPSLSELSADLQCQAGHQQIAKHSNQ